jgi:aspartate kinase
VLKKLSDAIHTIPVRLVSYGGSPHNISLLVPSGYKKETLQLLNKGLFGLE